MNVLIACEESQTVCIAFRKKGHNAFSCDIKSCSGGHPEWHIKSDVLSVLNPVLLNIGGIDVLSLPFVTMDGVKHDIKGCWDLIIAHPPCTYLSNAGARWLWAGHELNQSRYHKGLKGKEFFMQIYFADCPHIAIENPVPSSIFNLPSPTQLIQPFQFGHPFSKKTYLWLHGLSPLRPTDFIEYHVPFVTSGSYSKNHDPKYKGASRVGGAACSRSKTFSGIAAAMAAQWG